MVLSGHENIHDPLAFVNLKIIRNIEFYGTYLLGMNPLILISSLFCWPGLIEEKVFEFSQTCFDFHHRASRVDTNK